MTNKKFNLNAQLTELAKDANKMAYLETIRELSEKVISYSRSKGVALGKEVQPNTFTMAADEYNLIYNSFLVSRYSAQANNQIAALEKKIVSLKEEIAKIEKDKDRAEEVSNKKDELKKDSDTLKTIKGYAATLSDYAGALSLVELPEISDKLSRKFARWCLLKVTTLPNCNECKLAAIDSIYATCKAYLTSKTEDNLKACKTVLNDFANECLGDDGTTYGFQKYVAKIATNRIENLINTLRDIEKYNGVKGFTKTAIANNKKAFQRYLITMIYNPYGDFNSGKKASKKTVELI